MKLLWKSILIGLAGTFISYGGPIRGLREMSGYPVQFLFTVFMISLFWYFGSKLFKKSNNNLLNKEKTIKKKKE